jgi:quinoprotein glucose dehydrogenase
MRLLPILKSCLLFASPLVLLLACGPKKPYEWTRYGGNAFNNHYSPLTLIDTNNVASLSVAWEYHSGDADEKTQIQTNPLIVDGVLYGVSPKLKLFALDAGTGKELWNFNPVDTNTLEVKGRGYFSMNVCRGLSYFKGDEKDQRIFYSAGGFLHCIDALSGKPIKSFGTNGLIDLHNDLGRDLSQYYVAATTPGMVYKDMIIIGSRVAEDAAAAPGHIRAYDVHTGKLRWIFHTIPHPGEAGFESWDNKEAYQHIGGANAWSGFSLDEEKGILFAPIGSASYDFYGGKRTGDNLFANSVLALDAATGKRIWHFQTVHHDIWDRDLPTAPVVVNIHKEGKLIEAVVQVTKSGFIFLLERNTGKPVYPIVETAVPTETALLGEKPWPTQPIPSVFEPFARQVLLEKDLNRLVSDSSFKDIQQRLAGFKTGHLYHPPSKVGTVIFPGFDGGAEWGGPAVDPSTGIMYVNASEMPWILTMVDRKPTTAAKETNLDAGKRLYQTNCMPCHGPERKGAGNYPGLLDTKKKYNEEQFVALVTAGKQMMPAMTQLAASEKIAIASFILDLKDKQGKAFEAPTRTIDPWLELPYTSTGYHKFLTKEGYPAVMPPWGTLTAIDLNTGKQVWKDTLGDVPELKAKGIHSGTENYGGAVVTAGGLLFIAATKDSKFRAYNKRTGKLLLELDLPAPGFATPAVYEKNGKQFIVIACGGGKLKSKTSDTYLAFSINKP